MEFYIVNPKEFKGYAITTLKANDVSELETARCPYSKKTISELKQEYGESIVALTWDEFYEQIEKPYLISLQKPFSEISEEVYEDMLNCLPPAKWHDFAPGLNVFFCSEGYTADLHGCYIRDKVNNKYYSAIRSIYISDEELFNEFVQR